MHFSGQNKLRFLQIELLYSVLVQKILELSRKRMLEEQKTTLT